MVEAGHVYILTSPQCSSIKIGGTGYPPLKRIKEINQNDPYKSLGPWGLHDFRQVTDWRKVEYNLHYTFRSHANHDIAKQKELFKLSPVEAAQQLNAIDEVLIVNKPKVDRLFQDHVFKTYLGKLFRATAMLNWLELQGVWTLNLFPATEGGRYYTLNIGSHEVGFSTLPKPSRPQINMLHMDCLIHDFKPVRTWLKQRKGGVENDSYTSGLYRSSSVYFVGDFAVASEFLELTGVRRAMIAYWTEALIRLQEKGALSLHAKRHHWNAVAALKQEMLLGLI